MSKKYSDEDYKKAYRSLSNEQQEVLDNHIKEGYKTKWLYIFAKNKGLLEEDLIKKTQEEIADLKQSLEWDLIEYRDYLEVNRDIRCKCGRPLRHAYTVEHIPTGEVFILGSDHFMQYTNIKLNEVRSILSNFKLIDLEKAEILGKVIENRDVDISSKINKDFIVPKDIAKQLEVKLPLLNRQIKRLYSLGAFPSVQKQVTEYKSNYQDDKFNKDIFQKYKSPNRSPGQDPNPQTKPDYEVDIEEMLNKLYIGDYSLEDTQKYIEYLNYYKNLNHTLIEKERIKKVFYKALGNIPTSKLRGNLVEIEDIMNRYYKIY